MANQAWMEIANHILTNQILALRDHIASGEAVGLDLRDVILEEGPTR